MNFVRRCLACPDDFFSADQVKSVFLLWPTQLRIKPYYNNQYYPLKFEIPNPQDKNPKRQIRKNTKRFFTPSVFSHHGEHIKKQKTPYNLPLKVAQEFSLNSLSAKIALSGYHTSSKLGGHHQGSVKGRFPVDFFC